MDREFTLRDLFTILMHRSLAIVILTVLFTVICAGLGAYTVKKHNDQVNILREDDSYYSQLKAAKINLEAYNDAIANSHDYIANSILYSLNSYDVGQGAVVRSLPDYDIDDHKPSVFNGSYAYLDAFLNTPEVIENISALFIETAPEYKYVRELITVTTSGYNTFTVTVLYSDENIALEVAKSVADQLEALVNQRYGTQHVEEINSASTRITSESLQKKKDDTSSGLVKLEDNLKSIEDSLRALEDRATLKGYRNSVLKFGIIGILVGFIVSCALTAFLGVMDKHLLTVSELTRRYNVELLGILSLPNKGVFKKALNRFADYNPDALADNVKCTAVSINALSHGEVVYIVSTLDSKITESVLTTLKEAGGNVVLCGNILHDSCAIEILNNASSNAVLILERPSVSLLPLVDSEMRRLKQLKKTVIGVVVG